MTDQAPPLDPGNIRVILHMKGIKGAIYGDFLASRLPEALSDYINEGAKILSRPALIAGLDEGFTTARQIFAEALTVGENGYSIACISAVWICLYGDPHLPGFGLQLSDLEAAAGRGVLRVYVQDNGNTWEFEFEDGDQRICGRKVIPRAPQWAEHTAGNA